jgi:hypothetical protein
VERAEIERAVKLAGLELPGEVECCVIGQDPIIASPHFVTR